jgi:hemerythrin
MSDGKYIGRMNPGGAHPPQQSQRFFVWKDAFAVGDAEVDDEHQRFFALANRLHSSLMSHEHPALTREALLGMTEHARCHFEYEETCLIASSCPYLAEHRDEHRQFVLALEHLRLQENPSAEATFCLARDLIVDHILGMDRRHAHWLTRPGSAI